MAVLGQDFNIELLAIAFDQGIDQRNQFSQVGDTGGLGRSAEFAVKIPEIHTLGQVATALAFDVFADFVLGGFEHALGVFAFGFERKRFFHGGYP